MKNVAPKVVPISEVAPKDLEFVVAVRKSPYTVAKNYVEFFAFYNKIIVDFYFIRLDNY